MKGIRPVLGLLVLAVTAAITSSAFAEPTRDEAYRSDKLNIVVYKDSTDANVLWYLPPLKLYEDNGKVVFYKRPAPNNDGKVSYYFYVVPYMTDELIDMLAGELPNLQDKSQLKPVIARQFGIQVKQFNTAAMGDKITDYHYLNQPQLIKFDLDAANAADFDFFLNNKPGIQANVYFEFDSEKMDKYLNISLTYKEVYNALNIGVTGRYEFTQAEISDAIEHYLSQKYFNVKSKGDIPIPDIVQKVIMECFTPFQRQNGRPNNTNPWGNGWNTWGNNNNGWNNGNTWNTWGTGNNWNNNGWNNWFSGRAPSPEELRILNEQSKLLGQLTGDWGTGDDWGRPAGSSGASGGSGGWGNGDWNTGPSGGSGSSGWNTGPSGNSGGWGNGNGNWGGNNGGWGNGNWGNNNGWGNNGGWNNGPNGPIGGPMNGPVAVMFSFRKQFADSDKQFYYTQQHYTDTTDATEVPIFLSLLPSVVHPHVLVSPLAKKELVVETANSQSNPASSGIDVEQDQQYIINASFAMQASSQYDQGTHWYRWQNGWASVDEDLYYRVGTGPWNKVNGRTVIKAEGIYHGALQFYLDREHIWSKIPADYKKAKLLGTIPAIFTYQKTYPQYNVVITGRQVEQQ